MGVQVPPLAPSFHSIDLHPCHSISACPLSFLPPGIFSSLTRVNNHLYCHTIEPLAKLLEARESRRSGQAKRDPESSIFEQLWIPAFAGMTEQVTFARSSIITLLTNLPNFLLTKNIPFSKVKPHKTCEKSISYGKEGKSHLYKKARSE
jgi:hypothetical protein